MDSNVILQRIIYQDVNQQDQAESRIVDYLQIFILHDQEY